jgi:hypothetical protein
MSRVTLKQLIKQGFEQEPRDGTVTIFRNLRDGNLYRIYLASPRMYTGSRLIAERMFYPNGVTKRIPESHQKDYVVVSYR